MRALDAWIEGRRVGRFTESPQANGSALYAFEYNEVTSKDIVSLTMVPIEGERRFESPTFPPPFDMVLPEGDYRARIKDGQAAGFEEAAALMGETSATKYQREFGTMVDSLCEFISPKARAGARSTLTKCLVLNHLIGNGDAHLKNFGVLYDDAAHVSLAPIYDCVSTLPYIPGDVPALVLSFEWYSKAWWPRMKIEEFAVDYGSLSNAAIQRMFDEAFEAVLGGVKTVTQYGRDIAGFTDLAARMAKLWRDRVETFRAEESGLKRSRRRAKP